MNKRSVFHVRILFHIFYIKSYSLLNRFTSLDELIIAKEHFAEIGDDLDFTFVELIDGIEPIYTYRHPKPPTPPPRPETPPEIRAALLAAAAAAAKAGEPVVLPEGLVVPEGVEIEGLVAGLVAEKPGKEPSPFELQKHFPPDGAEVPFVKSFSPPKEPTPAPEPVPEAPAAEAPSETPAEAPSEAPAEQPAEAPAETPAETPAEQPAEAPATEAPPAEA